MDACHIWRLEGGQAIIEPIRDSIAFVDFILDMQLIDLGGGN